jgi:transposase
LLEKERAKIRPLIKATEQNTFACRADAEKEFMRLTTQKEFKLFICTADIKEEITEKWPPGRRNEKTKPIISTVWRIEITSVVNKEDACLKYINNESCIVLISNVTDPAITDRVLLETYKGQHIVENSFRQLKGPQLASVIYLKNPQRIQALTMVLSFALLIRALIQYRLRDGLAQHREKYPDTPIRAGWGGRELKNPTYKLFYEQTYNCRYEKERYGVYDFIWPNMEKREIVELLLKLMGLTVTTILK